MKRFCSIVLVVVLFVCMVLPAGASSTQPGLFTQAQETVIKSPDDGYSLAFRNEIGTLHRGSGVDDSVIALISDDSVILILTNRISVADYNSQFTDMPGMIDSTVRSLGESFSVTSQGELAEITHPLSSDAYAMDVTLKNNGNTLNATFTYIKTSKYVYVLITGTFGQVTALRQEALSDVVATLKEIN